MLDAEMAMRRSEMDTEAAEVEGHSRIPRQGCRSLTCRLGAWLGAEEVAVAMFNCRSMDGPGIRGCGRRFDTKTGL